MPKIQYINLPIYSIATYNEYYYISGGGGGKTGIKNQIFIYKHQITKEPVNHIQTGDKILENMIVDLEKKILIASFGDKIKIFNIKDGGLNLQQKIVFQADFASKNSTLNILCTAGQDMAIRFFNLNEQQKTGIKYFQHFQHSNPLKNVDHNDKNLFLSCDTNQIVITDIQTKKIIRKIFQDQLMPQKSLFQSAYFIESGSNQLLMSHYILRKAAYVTKQNSKGHFETAQITKDQSCLTAYHKSMQVLGIACGNGSTYMVKASNLGIVGKQHNHSFVITGCTMSRGGRFITGTPQCSYNVQQVDQPFFGCSCIPLLSLVFTLVFIFLLGSSLFFSDITQTDL